jgi:MFS family permease
MDPKLRAMLPLFAAVFIDLFSFGLMYPVIIIVFHQPAIEALYPPASRSIYLTLAFSLFPFGMFFGAALLGDLSDAFGRRRTLLISMAGLASAYVLMFIGVQTLNLNWLLAGRLLSGLMAGTSPIAQAAMMDRSTDEDRGTNMSHVVLVNCLALVSGPAAGGILAHWDLRAPLLFAVVMCGGAFAWIHHGMVATHTGRQALRLTWSRPFEVFLNAWRHQTIRNLAAAFFLFQFGFAIYYVYILVRMTNRYGVTPAVLGLFSAVIGVGFVVGSTALFAEAKRRGMRDAAVAMVGLLSCGALILLAAAPVGMPEQWVFAFLCACTNTLAFIGLLALISAAAGADEQGWALGIGSAMTALSFFLSGLFASVLALISLPLLIGLGGILVVAGALPLRAAMRQARAAPIVTEPLG